MNVTQQSKPFWLSVGTNGSGQWIADKIAGIFPGNHFINSKGTDRLPPTYVRISGLGSVSGAETMYPLHLRRIQRWQLSDNQSASQSVGQPVMRFSRRALLLVSSTLFLAACAAGTPNNEEGTAKVDTKSIEGNQRVTYNVTSSSLAEKISSLSYDGKVVTATVISNGCTTKDDFAIEYAVQDNHCYATVIRSKPDYCKVTPMPVQLLIPWEQPADCSNASITFTNPLLLTGPKSTDRKLPASSGN